jgi:RNA polymerase primary sigma factor
LNEKLDARLFQHPILSFERCRELSEIINAGDEENADAAKKEFVTCNLKLVRQIALGYRKTYPEVEIEDLFQMGVIGLIRATEKWDPLREFMFSTYATWWIRQSITRNATDFGSMIRIPVHMKERLDKVQSYLENYFDFFGFDPEPLEAADALQINEMEYKQIRESAFSFVPLRKVLDSSSELSVGVINSNFESKSICDSLRLIEWDNFVEQLNNVLATLTEREAGVVAMRFGINSDAPMTLEEIGKIYGVTRERIRQIESKAMTKLRHPSRSLVLKDYLVGFDFEVHQVPGELHQNNFVLANEPQD